MKKRGYVLISAFVIACMITPCAFAENYDLKVMTPEVKAALDGRRARYDELNTFKADGIIGENNHGYVELLGPQDRALTLVEEENHDRRIIYETIAEQNNLTGALSTIETVFAGVQRAKAEPGEHIQNEEGVWIQK